MPSREAASTGRCPAPLVRLGKDQKATTHPHGFATRELVQGHDHLTVAELMGHRDGTMLAKVYGHLDRDTAHLKRALAD